MLRKLPITLIALTVATGLLLSASALAQSAPPENTVQIQLPSKQKVPVPTYISIKPLKRHNDFRITFPPAPSGQTIVKAPNNDRPTVTRGPNGHAPGITIFRWKF